MNSEKYVLISEEEYKRLKQLEQNLSSPCESCPNYNKPLWIIPEAHPCRHCRKPGKQVVIPIITLQ